MSSAGQPGEALRARVEAADFNPLGSGFVLSGAVLLLLSFTVLDWFRGAINFARVLGRSGSRFGDVSDFLSAFRAEVAGEPPVRGKPLAGYFSTSVSSAYFSWLAWVLLVVVLAGCLVANSRIGRDHSWFRWLGAVLAATGVGLTFLALDLILAQGDVPTSVGLPQYGDYLSNSAVGAWSAIAGFLLMLAGCLVPRRDR